MRNDTTKIIAETLNVDWSERGYRRRGELSMAARWTKRTFDLIASAAGMIGLSPVFLVIYLLIKREDGGPAIFKQERIGYGGKPFILYKFRSMEVASEPDGLPTLCQTDDERLTRIGRFLRDHHLDELPQLWNVFTGKMSFVGPRPERKFFVDQITAINANYELLYRLRPGLFSMATLYNGYTATMDKMLDRLRIDLDYLYNRTFWLDMKITFLTVPSILSGKKF